MVGLCSMADCLVGDNGCAGLGMSGGTYEDKLGGAEEELGMYMFEVDNVGGMSTFGGLFLSNIGADPIRGAGLGML